jgi:hypothetical protein
MGRGSVTEFPAGGLSFSFWAGTLPNGGWAAGSSASSSGPQIEIPTERGWTASNRAMMKLMDRVVEGLVCGFKCILGFGRGHRLGLISPLQQQEGEDAGEGGFRARRDIAARRKSGSGRGQKQSNAEQKYHQRRFHDLSCPTFQFGKRT